MKNLKKFVCNLDVIISGLSLCAIVVITLAGVIMRKIMNQPIAWLEEMQLLIPRLVNQPRNQLKLLPGLKMTILLKRIFQEYFHLTPWMI